jgi:hypothetical protein
MVNAGMVNEPASYFLPPQFCEFFRDSARFPRLKNPVKYTRVFKLNHKTVYSTWRGRRGNQESLQQKQCLIGALRLWEGVLAIMAAE